jgi:hypothetical protein
MANIQIIIVNVDSSCEHRLSVTSIKSLIETCPGGVMYTHTIGVINFHTQDKRPSFYTLIVRFLPKIMKKVTYGSPSANQEVYI